MEGQVASTSTRQRPLVQVDQGMGAALNVASASEAYVLSDRATWVHFENKADLEILVQGDKRLFNQYGIMLVNPEKHPGCQKGVGPGVHRLSDLASWATGYRGLQAQRTANAFTRTPMIRPRGGFFGLLAEFGEANIPLRRVAPKYFGLSFEEARRRAPRRCCRVRCSASAGKITLAGQCDRPRRTDRS